MKNYLIVILVIAALGFSAFHIVKVTEINPNEAALLGKVQEIKTVNSKLSLENKEFLALNKQLNKSLSGKLDAIDQISADLDGLMEENQMLTHAMNMSDCTFGYWWEKVQEYRQEIKKLKETRQ